MLKKMLVSSIAILVLLGCNYTREKNLPQSENGESHDYTFINTNILQPYCLSCHSGIQTPDLTTYESVVSNVTKIQHTVIETGTMPKNRKMDPLLKEKLKVWILAGMPKTINTPQTTQPGNTRNTPVPKPNSVVTYNEIRNQVLIPKCLSCHHSGQTDQPNFEDEQVVRQYIQEILDSAVTSELMPPPSSGQTQNTNPNALPANLKELLNSWFQQGLK